MGITILVFGHDLVSAIEAVKKENRRQRWNSTLELVDVTLNHISAFSRSTLDAGSLGTVWYTNKQAGLRLCINDVKPIKVD